MEGIQRKTKRPAQRHAGQKLRQTFQTFAVSKPREALLCSLRIPAKSVKEQFARSVKAYAARQAQSGFTDCFLMTNTP